jgi:prepilin-type N-terminal cleavage/methylation domain-containing protein
MRSHLKKRVPLAPHASERGFTLLEMIVVVGITFILSSFIIIYGRSGRQISALYVEQAQIANVLAKAKELAVATYLNPGSSPACAYGVHFDYGKGNGTYQIFAYVTSSVTSVATCGALPNATRDEVETLNTSVIPPANGSRDLVPNLSEHELDSNLRFFDPNGGTSDRLRDVVFIPPEPHAVVWTDGQDTSSTVPGVIYLETVSSNGQASTTVNLAGQISF